MLDYNPERRIFVIETLNHSYFTTKCRLQGTSVTKSPMKSQKK